MDGNRFYPLRPCFQSPRHESVCVVEMDDVSSSDEPYFEFPSWLRQRLLALLLLLLLAARIIRHLLLERVSLRQQAHYWHSLHQRTRQREVKLQQRVQQLQAQIRDLKKRLFGRKTETAAATTTNANGKSRKSTRPRGQQRGTKGPSRRDFSHLSTDHEPCQIHPEQRRCSTCGATWRKLPGSDDGQILEVEVRAYRRVYHRERYERT